MSHLEAVFFFFQAEDGIRYRDVTGVPDVCSSDLPQKLVELVPKPGSTRLQEKVHGVACNIQKELVHFFTFSPESSLLRSESASSTVIGLSPRTVIGCAASSTTWRWRTSPVTFFVVLPSCPVSLRTSSTSSLYCLKLMSFHSPK